MSACTARTHCGTVHVIVVTIDDGIDIGIDVAMVVDVVVVGASVDEDMAAVAALTVEEAVVAVVA